MSTSSNRRSTNSGRGRPRGSRNTVSNDDNETGNEIDVEQQQQRQVDQNVGTRTAVQSCVDKYVNDLKRIRNANKAAMDRYLVQMRNNESGTLNHDKAYEFVKTVIRNEDVQQALQDTKLKTCVNRRRAAT